MPRYTYHIVDRDNQQIESNIPTRAQAETYLEFLRDKYPHETYAIKETTIYTVKGLGRDPDLH